MFHLTQINDKSLYSRQLRAFNGGAEEPDWQGKLPEYIYNKVFDAEGKVRPVRFNM